MAYIGYSYDVLPLPFHQHEYDPGEVNSCTQRTWLLRAQLLCTLYFKSVSYCMSVFFELFKVVSVVFPHLPLHGMQGEFRFVPNALALSPAWVLVSMA